MYNLNQFQQFDIEKFLKGKVLKVLGIRDWIDFDTKKILGTIVDTVIWVDKTEYKVKNGEIKTNAFEKLPLKIGKKVSVEIDAFVMPVHAIASIYGDYRNKLSVKCDDVKIISNG